MQCADSGYIQFEYSYAYPPHFLSCYFIMVLPSYLCICLQCKLYKTKPIENTHVGMVCWSNKQWNILSEQLQRYTEINNHAAFNNILKTHTGRIYR